jgi:TNF receptor-associated protein 1
VNLYSRKVLIENKPADLLPSWLRFLKGVVDSEDLPLSIAREKAQDSLLLKKINDVLTRKV